MDRDVCMCTLNHKNIKPIDDWIKIMNTEKKKQREGRETNGKLFMDLAIKVKLSK